jgi:hypothetical protein
MGALQRTKGHNFERDIAALYRRRWPTATVRRSLQSHAAFEPDVVIEGDVPDVVARLWTECQCSNNPTPLVKLEQAERDCAKSTETLYPVVVWRKSGSRTTYATCRLDTLVELFGDSRVSGGHFVVTVALDDLLRGMP